MLDSEEPVIYPAVFYQVYLEPNSLLLTAQIEMLSALALVTYAILTTHFAKWLIGGIVGVVIGGVALATVSPVPVQLRDAPRHPPCASKGGVRLCVWPEQSRSLRPGLDALVSVKLATQGFLDTPNSYSQPGLKVVGASQYLVPEANAPRDAYVFLAVRATAPQQQCGTADAEKAWLDVMEWMEGRTSGVAGASEGVGGVLSMSDSAQQEWLDQRLRSLRC